MVLVYVGETLYEVCQSIETAEVRYGTAWSIMSEKLPSGQVIYRLIIGVA